MARKRRDQEWQAGELNLTAMIDVAFQLLNFFIISTHPVDVMTNLDVFRPSTEERPQNQDVEPPQMLEIMVHADGYAVQKHLVELSENYEGFDNIVVFWDPKNKPAPLQPCRFSYTLRWMSDTIKLSEEKVVSTRMGLDAGYANARQFVIDFDGPKLDAIPESDLPQAVANCSPNAAKAANCCTAVF